MKKNFTEGNIILDGRISKETKNCIKGMLRARESDRVDVKWVINHPCFDKIRSKAFSPLSKDNIETLVKTYMLNTGNRRDITIAMGNFFDIPKEEERKKSDSLDTDDFFGGLTLKSFDVDMNKSFVNFFAENKNSVRKKESKHPDQRIFYNDFDNPTNVKKKSNEAIDLRNSFFVDIAEESENQTEYISSKNVGTESNYNTIPLDTNQFTYTKETGFDDNREVSYDVTDKTFSEKKQSNPNKRDINETIKEQNEIENYRSYTLTENKNKKDFVEYRRKSDTYFLDRKTSENSGFSSFDNPTSNKTDPSFNSDSVKSDIMYNKELPEEHLTVEDIIDYDSRMNSLKKGSRKKIEIANYKYVMKDGEMIKVPVDNYEEHRAYMNEHIKKKNIAFAKKKDMKKVIYEN